MDWSSFLPALLGALTAIAGLVLGDWLRRRSDRLAQSHRAAIAARESTFALARLIMNVKRDGDRFSADIRDDVSQLADAIRGHAIQVENETVRERLIRNANVLDGAESLVGYTRDSPSSVAWPVKEWTDAVVKAYVNGTDQPAESAKIAAADEELRDLYLQWEDNWQSQLEYRREQAQIQAANAAEKRTARAAEDNQTD